MDQRSLVLIAIAVIVVIFMATLLLMRRRKSERFKQRYGPEYDRTLRQQGDSKRAEAVLSEREKRVEKFSVRPLSGNEREKYTQEWAAVQRQFVDDPSFAVTEADKLLTTVMAARGYPIADFEQRAADISVNYPGLVENYRSARDIVINRNKGQGTTEDLRQAIVHYRSLFDEVLGSSTREKIRSMP